MTREQREKYLSDLTTCTLNALQPWVLQKLGGTAAALSLLENPSTLAGSLVRTALTVAVDKILGERDSGEDCCCAETSMRNCAKHQE